MFSFPCRLPVLAGAAGALGSAYGSPYIALESAYHSRPSGQTSSSGAPRSVVFFFPFIIYGLRKNTLFVLSAW